MTRSLTRGLCAVIFGVGAGGVWLMRDAGTRTAADLRASDASVSAASAEIRAEIGVGRPWFEGDLEAVLERARAIAANGEASAALLASIESLAETDPERAVRIAQVLSSCTDQRRIFERVFETLVRRDPVEAVRWLETLPVGGGREPALAALVAAWARMDFDAAHAWVNRLGDAAERTQAIEIALGALAERTPLTAIALAQDALSGEARARAVLAAIEHLAAHAPNTAARFVSTLPAADVTAAARAVAGHYATHDLAAALAWANALPHDGARVSARGEVLARWAAADPRTAAAHAAAVAQDGLDPNSAMRIAEALARVSPSEALAWTGSLPTAIAGAAQVEIAAVWANYEPERATRWAATQPPDPLQAERLRATLGAWMATDASRACDFVAALPPSLLGSAAAVAAECLAKSDPAGAVAWANTLPSRDAASAAIVAVYEGWIRRDPSAALAWRASAGLSPQLIARLPDEEPAI